jgi:hypothetical protein
MSEITITQPENSQPEDQAIDAATLVQATEAKHEAAGAAQTAEETKSEVQALRDEMQIQLTEIKQMISATAAVTIAAAEATVTAVAEPEPEPEMTAGEVVVPNVEEPSEDSDSNTQPDAPESTSEEKPAKNRNPVLRLLLGK